MNLETIKSHVEDWRGNNGVDGSGPLSLDQTQAFVQDLHVEVGKFSVQPERVDWGTYGPDTPLTWDAHAQVIPYSGNAGDVPGWKVAKALSENGEGKLAYISDCPAGQLLNAGEFRNAVAQTVGGDDRALGTALANDIFDGHWSADGVRSKFGVGDQLALNDLVSKKLMETVAEGDVRTITADAPNDRVFVQTELPALLGSERVTAINGVPIESLRELHQASGSLLEVNAVVAQASRELMEGTRYTLNGGDGADGRRPDQIASVDGAKLFEGSGIAGPAFAPNGAEVKVISTEKVAVLSIDTMDTAAFEDMGRNIELSSVLTDAAQKIQDGATPPFPLQDTNGNDVGRFEIMAAAPQAAPEPGTARLQFDMNQPEFKANPNEQLAQSIMVAADQVATQPSSDRIVVASPEGKTIGTLDVSAPTPAPVAAPQVERQYECPAP